MAYSPAPFDTFGLGLNLRDKADAVRMGEAIDALNVVFTERGAVAQRHGYDNFTPSALTNRVASLHAHYRAGSGAQLLAGCGTRLEALDTAGAVVASATGLTDGTWDFVRFGTPNSEISYAGQGNQTLRSWDGSAWAAVASTPQAGALCVMSRSNRMVAARFNTTTGGPTGGAGTSSPSHVYFSDAGSATGWTANNFVQLDPGDGEKIQAVIEWNDQVFVFKETKFYVFGAESTSATGTPIFNYYPVRAGVGLASPRAICASEHGIFFLHRDGVYVTTGNAPSRVSDLITPIFLGGSSDYYLGGELDQPDITNCAMEYHDGRLYLSFTSESTANNRTLVYDPTYEWWSLWDVPASSLLSFKVSDKPELFFGYASGSNHVGRYGSAYTNDDGVAITSRWRSGWFDYGQPEVKTIRESKVWGSGKVSLGVGFDQNEGTGTLTLLDLTDPDATTWGGSTWGGGFWGAGRARVAALRRVAVRGTVFSTYFTNSTLNQTWTISRLEHHLREARIPSIKDA